MYIRRGDLTEGFLRYEFGGLIFGGAYTWRGLFSEFYGILCKFDVKQILPTDLLVFLGNVLNETLLAGS